MKNFSFDIFGTKWRVCFVDKITSDDNKFVFGHSDATHCCIQIAKNDIDGKPFSTSELQLVFFHELMHTIFAEGLYFDENDNEPLVEWCAKCLSSISKQNKLLLNNNKNQDAKHSLPRGAMR